MRNFDEAKIIANSKKYDCYILEKRCGEYEIRGTHECGGKPSNVVYIHRYTPDKSILQDTGVKKSKSTTDRKPGKASKPTKKSKESGTTKKDLGGDS